MIGTPIKRHHEASASGNRRVWQGCRLLAAVALIAPILLAATNRAPAPSPGRDRESQGAQEDAAMYSQGRFVYERNCLVCHGKWGDGKGEAAANLKDAWEEPCPPLDLRQPFIRSGAERKDIYRALLTGLDGTPMPSFRETTSEEQRWELIAHIEQLRRDHRAQSEAKIR